MKNKIILKEDLIINKIFHLRCKRIMLDSDLAALYGIETRRLNEQVKRNLGRFPDDFMFQLAENEFEVLMSQNATSSWGGKRKMPFAFTEHGVLMLSSVINSAVAIEMNIQIMRVFTKVRELLLRHKNVLMKLEKIEKRLMQNESRHENHEKELQVIFAALKSLLEPKPTKRKKIGYKISSKK